MSSCSRKLHLLAGAALLLSAALGTACPRHASAQVLADHSPPAGESRFVPDEVILTFSAHASPQAIRRFARRYDLIELESVTLPSIATTLSRWHIGGHRSVPSVVGALQNQRIVASAQPNYLFALEEQTGEGGR